MQNDIGPVKIRVDALSSADSLGYRGQLAVAKAVGHCPDYLLIGGHMVRLLLEVYPTKEAVPRSTIDADTALKDVEVVGPVTQHLQNDGFTKDGGNILTKELGNGQKVEVNILLPRDDPKGGIKHIDVPDVGQVDTLSELSFALISPAVIIDIEAHLFDGEVINYQTRVPTVEIATILKAHSWKDRKKKKDLADLNTLLEIRRSYPNTSWGLNSDQLKGRRLDTAKILHDLENKLQRKNNTIPLPDSIDRLRFRSLIRGQIGMP